MLCRFVWRGAAEDSEGCQDMYPWHVILMLSSFLCMVSAPLYSNNLGKQSPSEAR